MHPAFARRLAALLVLPFVLAACNDDDPGGAGLNSRLVQTLEPNVSYFLVVDLFSAASTTGSVTLTSAAP